MVRLICGVTWDDRDPIGLPWHPMLNWTLVTRSGNVLSEVPGSYREYLRLLHDVFQECYRVLEPGGRMAVNVANLGRKPYRSLSADVIRIFGDLGLFLRGGQRFIPACAGEPTRESDRSDNRKVYPRVCGGTHFCSSSAPSNRGLSPRVRGNQ